MEGMLILGFAASFSIVLFSYSTVAGALLIAAFAGLVAVTTWGLPSRMVILRHEDIKTLAELDEALHNARSTQTVDDYDLGLVVEGRNQLVKTHSADQITTEAFKEGVAQLHKALLDLTTRPKGTYDLSPELVHALRLKEETQRVSQRLAE